MRKLGHFLLSFVVALLAAFVVGMGACGTGMALSDFYQVEVLRMLATGFIFGAIPIGGISFILVMVKMWHMLNDKDDQQAEFKLPPKTTDQPPPDSEA